MKLSKVKALYKESKELAEKVGGFWLERHVELQNMLREGKLKEEVNIETQTLKADRVCHLSSKAASDLKIGDVIIVERKGRGRNEVIKAQKVVQIKNVSNHFVEVNGRKMKKTSSKSTFQGYGKMIG